MVAHVEQSQKLRFGDVDGGSAVGYFLTGECYLKCAKKLKGQTF